MADYIYLLQHRLNSNQRRALEAVRDAARNLGAPVFLVGGAVRDLTSGAPVRDLDFAVQGEVAGLLDALTSAGARLMGEDQSFQSRYLAFPGGIRVEVGPTLSVTYPQPVVPEVQSAPILDDLRRRDFTANAMAISLNEGSYGLLLDPLNGVADLENREIRLVSNLGFIEQPALLVRAARLSHRLGWSLEEKTQRRYQNAKEEGAMERLSASARAYELEEIFHEEDPISAMEHLRSEDWLTHLSAELAGLRSDQEGLDRVRDTLGQLEQLGIFADPSAVYFPLLTAKLAAAEASTIKLAFARAGFAEQIDTLEARSRELAAQLTSRAHTQPSATWKLLFEAEPEVVLALGSASRTSAIQTKFKAFFTEWPQARQRTPYALMQEMRITPEITGYAQLLEDLFFALMDGKLSTPEEMRAFLEPFSPPAPAQQVAPRRRAAKSARGRGRPAAAKSIDLDEGEDEGEPTSSSADADDESDEAEDVSPSRSSRAGVNDEDSEEPDDDGEEDDDADEDKMPPPSKPSSPARVESAPKKSRASEEQDTGATPLSSSKKKAASVSQPAESSQPGKLAASAAHVETTDSPGHLKPAPHSGGKTSQTAGVSKSAVKTAKQAPAKAALSKAVSTKEPAKTSPATATTPAKAAKSVSAKAVVATAKPGKSADKATVSGNKSATATPAAEKKQQPVAKKTPAKATGTATAKRSGK